MSEVLNKLRRSLLEAAKTHCLEKYEEYTSNMSTESRIQLTSMMLTHIVKDCILNAIFCGERDPDKLFEKMGIPLVEITDCLQESLGHSHGDDCNCRKKFEESFRAWVKHCVKCNEEAKIQEREKN